MQDERCLLQPRIRTMRGCHALLLLTLLACAGAPPPPEAPAPADAAPAPPAVVWASDEGVSVRAAQAVVELPYPFMRLDVLGADSLGLHVRCGDCPGLVEGYVSPQEVVHTPLPPGEAAAGTL